VLDCHQTTISLLSTCTVSSPLLRRSKEYCNIQCSQKPFQGYKEKFSRFDMWPATQNYTRCVDGDIQCKTLAHLTCCPLKEETSYSPRRLVYLAHHGSFRPYTATELIHSTWPR
jgi:hypothetical protein